MAFVVNSALAGSYVTFFTDLKKRLSDLEAAGEGEGSAADLARAHEV